MDQRLVCNDSCSIWRDKLVQSLLRKHITPYPNAIMEGAADNFNINWIIVRQLKSYAIGSHK